MKRLIICLLACSFLSSTIFAQETERLEELLFELPDIQFKRLDDTDGFPTYILKVKQTVDHKDHSKGYFHQRVWLVHRGFDNNMVINTNGYSLNSRTTELFELLQSNYMSVEHRYFGPSTPDPKNWDYLTIQQATADYHYIKTLLGQIYQQKWISTGVSKGGETCTYYKYFYPDDVAVSVPYVAPFPNALKDKRIYAFLDTIGTEGCRKNVFDFQKRVLKNKKQLAPLFKYFLKGRKASVDLLGGPEAALELFVLEYPFGLWQNGKSCAEVPDATATPEELLNHLLDNDDFSYLFDEISEYYAAHYYQHATQLGYYGYLTEPFGGLISHWPDETSACFFPEKELTFKGKVRSDLMKWIQGEATDIIFLYGGTDTWTACQMDIGMNNKLSKHVFDGKHHGNARLNKVDDEQRDKILEWVKERL